MNDMIVCCPKCGSTNVGEHTSITIDPNEMDRQGDPVVISWEGYMEYQWCYDCNKEVRLMDEEEYRNAEEVL